MTTFARQIELPSGEHHTVDVTNLADLRRQVADFFSNGSEGRVPLLSSEKERSEEDQQRCQPEEVAVPVLAPVASNVASFAAAVVLKSLLGMESPTYIYLDLKQPRLHTMPVKQHPSCFVCGNPQEYELPYDES